MGSHFMSVHLAKSSSPSLPSAGHMVGRLSISVMGSSLSNQAIPLQIFGLGQATVIKSSGRPNHSFKADALTRAA